MSEQERKYMPELPAPLPIDDHEARYSEQQMRDYARAALAQQAVPDLYERIAQAHDASLDDDHRGCRVILTECMSLLTAAPAAPQAEQQAVPSDDEIVQDGRVFASNCEYLDGRCVRLDFAPHRLVAFVRAALAAQQAERDPLTDEQIRQLWAFYWVGDRIAFVRAIERAHGIGKEGA